MYANSRLYFGTWCQCQPGKTRSHVNSTCLLCDIGGTKEPGVMCFATKWGAKNAQNPQNHRVVVCGEYAGTRTCSLTVTFPKLLGQLAYQLLNPWWTNCPTFANTICSLCKRCLLCDPHRIWIGKKGSESRQMPAYWPPLPKSWYQFESFWFEPRNRELQESCLDTCRATGQKVTAPMRRTRCCKFPFSYISR